MLPTTMRPTTTKAGRLRLIALATLFFTVPNAEAASAPAIDPNEAVGQLMTCIQSCMWPSFVTCNCALGDWSCLCQCSKHGDVNVCSHQRCKLNADQVTSDAIVDGDLTDFFDRVCPKSNTTTSPTSTGTSLTLSSTTPSISPGTINTSAKPATNDLHGPPASTKVAILTSTADPMSMPPASSGVRGPPVTATYGISNGGAASTGLSGAATITSTPSKSFYPSSLAVVTTSMSWSWNGSAHPTNRTNSTAKVTISGADSKRGLFADLAVAAGLVCLFMMWL